MYSRSKHPFLPHRGFAVLFVVVCLLRGSCCELKICKVILFLLLCMENYFFHSLQFLGAERMAHSSRWTFLQVEERAKQASQVKRIMCLEC